MRSVVLVLGVFLCGCAADLADEGGSRPCDVVILPAITSGPELITDTVDATAGPTKGALLLSIRFAPYAPAWVVVEVLPPGVGPGFPRTDLELVRDTGAVWKSWVPGDTISRLAHLKQGTYTVDRLHTSWVLTSAWPCIGDRDGQWSWTAADLDMSKADFEVLNDSM